LVSANFNPIFESWKISAKDFISQKTSPHLIKWGSDLSLFSEEQILTNSKKTMSISKELASLLKSISWSSDENRWSLMYRLLYRFHFEDRNILFNAADPDVREATLMSKSIGRDIHKMHAFVRFKKTLVGDEEYFVAWHEPEHNIIRPGSEFFQRRFGDKKWSLYSSTESAHWDLSKLTFGEGMKQSDFLHVDKCDDLWKEYYSSIYNPARLNLKCMTNEMPRKYWASMPETSIINKLVAETPQRLEAMRNNTQKIAEVDFNWGFEELESKKKNCNACSFKCSEVHDNEFGQGPISAKVMVVSDRPLTDSQKSFLSREHEERIYFTSVIKSTTRSKIFGSDISACQPWLFGQLKYIKPMVILSVGQKSSIALIGKLINAKEEKGNVYNIESFSSSVVIADNTNSDLNYEYINEIFKNLGKVGNFFEVSKIGA